MFSRTLAVIGLTLQQTVLAQDCNSSFASTKAICERHEDETNPLSMCVPDCMEAVNETLPLCMNGETYIDDDGKTENIAEMLTMMLQMCTSPCMSNIMALGSQGCIHMGEEEPSEAMLAAMCTEDCKGAYASFPKECREQYLDDTTSFGSLMDRLEANCEPCMQAFMAMMPCSDSMCTQHCGDLLTAATTACMTSDAAIDMNGTMMSISNLLYGYTMMATDCNPSTPPAPSPGSTGCVQIPKAMAEKHNAKPCY